MSDIEILQQLGLAIEEQQIIFYDNYTQEHKIDFDSLKEVTIEKAYTPIYSRLSYWFSFLAVVKNPFSVRRLFNVEDYRENYELELELNDGKVLSRIVKDINLHEVESFLDQINKAL